MNAKLRFVAKKVVKRDRGERKKVCLCIFYIKKKE